MLTNDLCRLLFLAYVFHLAACRDFSSSSNFFPANASTAAGSVWPKPRDQLLSTTTLAILPNKFFLLSDSKCDIVQKALARYRNLIFPETEAFAADQLAQLSSLRIVVKNDGDCGYPQDGMNETYSLGILSSKAVLNSESPWGALRGLETFSQMVYSDEKLGTYLINYTILNDGPRYGFRGILLDTSRHFLPTKVIKQNLEAMAYNKFNVFHWHIVDDQSWPLQMETFPNLTDAAFHPTLIYSREDVQEIIEFARLRGIRVLPEIDTPGHTQALGNILPEILTPCSKGRAVLNVARPQTYTTMLALFSEVKKLFKDEFIHLGMDEVDYTCWKNSSEITELMKKMDLKTYPEVEEYYVRKTLNNIRDLGTKYIIWQDPINNGVEPAPDTIVGVWLDHYADNTTKKHGYKIILSAPWYLNYINYGEDWQKYYEIEPTTYPATAPEKDLIIGGEACMWGEWVDATNLLPRMWPRASAVAERLWSDESVNNVNEARFRLHEHRCRMLRRGIPAEPLGPGTCGTIDGTFK